MFTNAIPTMSQQNNNIKFAFFGTPHIAVTTLDILSAHGLTPALIVTNSDKPQGRKHILTPSPVKVWAQQHNIPFIDNENISELLETLQKESWDVCIAVAYGHILPQELIDLPRYGTLNIHYSLLPRWRGASPVEAAILAGDLETGVTIQKMVYKLDAGDVIARNIIPLNGNETTISLKETMATLGGELLADTLPKFVANEITLEAQDESLATRCGKIKKEDAEILSTDSEEIKWRKYRGLIERKPYFMEHGLRNIITDAIFENASPNAEGGRGKFKIKEIIPEGKTRTPYFG